MHQQTVRSAILWFIAASFMVIWLIIFQLHHWGPFVDVDYIVLDIDAGIIWLLALIVAGTAPRSARFIAAILSNDESAAPLAPLEIDPDRALMPGEKLVLRRNRTKFQGNYSVVKMGMKIA